MASRSEMLLMALAVRQTLIEKGQVQECMEIQKQLEAEGKPVSLEDIAIRKGYMTPADIAALKEPEPDAAPMSIPLEDARRLPKYEVYEQIGRGGMATVFRGVLKATGEARAIKVLYREHAGNRQFVERFVNEGKLLQGYNHPNIAKGYEVGRAGEDLYYMGMEMLSGRSLQDILDENGPFNEETAIYCITEAAKGLAYLQGEGIVHRDIKPENIMWCDDGRIVLVDLGFAKRIDGSNAGQTESETCGTVQYISPEQARGMSDLDVRADIYSLGCTLYHLVIGALPFSGSNSMDIMVKQVMDSLNSDMLKGSKSRISHQMYFFIEKMMAKERDNRFQSAQEVVDELIAVQEGFAKFSGRTPAAAPTSGPHPAVKPQQSSRMPAARPGAAGQQQQGTAPGIRMPQRRAGGTTARMAAAPNGGSQRTPAAQPASGGSQRAAPVVARPPASSGSQRAAPVVARPPAGAPQQPPAGAPAPQQRPVRLPERKRQG